MFLIKNKSKKAPEELASDHYWKYEKIWTTTDCNLTTAACLSLDKNEWVVHGLWPQKTFHRHPSSCWKSHPEYQFSMINENLKLRLSQKWLSYFRNRLDELLWKLEWEKHGSCAADLESLKNISNYFTKTLELFDLYDMGKILEGANIFPGKHSYKIERIIQAVKSQLGIIPLVTCAVDKADKRKRKEEQYINDIRICMNKSFMLQNCTRLYLDQCDHERNIIYYSR